MSWSATTAGHSGDVVRDVMLAALEHRFGNADQVLRQIEWLSDNGSGYIAKDTGVRQTHWPEAVDYTRAQPSEQRHG